MNWRRESKSDSRNRAKRRSFSLRPSMKNCCHYPENLRQREAEQVMPGFPHPAASGAVAGARMHWQNSSARVWKPGCYFRMNLGAKVASFLLAELPTFEHRPHRILAQPSYGSTVFTFACLKSIALRVATVNSCRFAVAAIIPSASGKSTPLDFAAARKSAQT